MREELSKGFDGPEVTNSGPVTKNMEKEDEGMFRHFRRSYRDIPPVPAVWQMAPSPKDFVRGGFLPSFGIP